MLRRHLQTARRAATRHAIAADGVGFTAHEQALTEVVLTRAAPSARVYTFSHREEGRVGADWMWWWQGTREWFGVIVQAKKNKPRKPGSPWYDFGYRTRSGGRQIDLLLATAHRYGVPGAYVLYNHPTFDRSVPVSDPCCRHPRESWRTRLRVAVVPALIVADLVGNPSVAAQHARPLECLVCRGPAAPPAWPTAAGITSEDLRRVLTGEEADLPRIVARNLLTQLAGLHRAQRPEAARPDGGPMPQTPDRVFIDLPEDGGRFSESYFEHVLKGLRTQAPEYVTALQQGVPFDEVHTGLEGVDGVVIWREDPRAAVDATARRPE